MTKQRHFFLILILGTLSALGPFSIDMYLPGFKAIAKDLNTSVANVSLSLSSFFIGIAFGQLLYGPLLDRYGRKKPLYVGLGIYFVASLGCALADSIETLIFLRFVQAIGSCAAGVASVAMVRDLFPVKDNAKVFSLLLLVVGISPMLAPWIGGEVTLLWGWHSMFNILAIISALIIIAIYLGLPESSKPNPEFSLKPNFILTSFWIVLKHPQFYTYALTGAVAFSGLFAYIAGSPIIFLVIFKLSEREYTWIFAFLSVGFIGSSQLNSILLKKYKSEQIVFYALILMCMVTIVFLTGTLLNAFGITATIVFIFLFLSCLGLTFPNASALSIAPFSNNAGIASSLMGFLQMLSGSIASMAVSLFNNQTSMPMIAIMVFSATFALTVLLYGRRKVESDIKWKLLKY